jgi:hypothetical protein
MRYVYTSDGYGGIVRVELDDKQDVCWNRGELWDQYDGIEDFLANNVIFDTLLEAAEYESENHG